MSGELIRVMDYLFLTGCFLLGFLLGRRYEKKDNSGFEVAKTLTVYQEKEIEHLAKKYNDLATLVRTKAKEKTAPGVSSPDRT